MKRTLFISDLDGTLLTPDAVLPEGTADRINRLTSAGVMITYATARTVRSVSHILRDIDFSAEGSVPAALMNGVLVRDMKNGRYIRKAVLGRDAADRIFRIVTGCGLEPFVYALDEACPIDGDPLVTYYRSVKGDAMRDFMNERLERYKKPFIRIASLDEIGGDIVYFAILGRENEIRRAAAEAEKIDGIRLTYYRDSYAEDVWYLEIFDESASKKHALIFLRDYTGADEAAAFGDNYNDLPMLEEADIAVAVRNAVAEVKKAADCITGDVVGFIENYVNNGEMI